MYLDKVFVNSVEFSYSVGANATENYGAETDNKMWLLNDGRFVNFDRYTADMDDVAFLNSELVQDAVIRNIEILGEASNNVQREDPKFAAQHAHIPWQVMYTMRNRVSHGYDKVDLEIVWKTIQRDLPELYRQVQALAAR